METQQEQRDKRGAQWQAEYLSPQLTIIEIGIETPIAGSDLENFTGSINNWDNENRSDHTIY